jgi:hypothetical protein
MGEVGRWDEKLFRAFRRARRVSERPERRRLLSELIRLNEPLIKDLVWQRKQWTPGAEHLDWEDALNAGRIAFAKAMQRFDPSKARLSTYLRLKIIHELQCAARTQSPTVVMPRGMRAPAAHRYEDDAELDRLTAGAASLLEDDGDDELLEEPLAPPVTAPAPRDVRPALEAFLEEHCRFAPAAREAMCVVHLRFERYALERGEYFPPGSLTRALSSRGVRPTTVRVPWADRPVKGLRGLGLQTDIRSPERAIPPHFRPLPRFVTWRTP